MIGGRNFAGHGENVSEVIEVWTVEQSRRFELCVSEIYSIFKCFPLRKFVEMFIKDRGTVKWWKVVIGDRRGQHFSADLLFERGDFVSFSKVLI